MLGRRDRAELLVFRGHDRDEIQPSSASHVPEVLLSALAWARTADLSPRATVTARLDLGGRHRARSPHDGPAQRCTVTTLSWSPDGSRISSTGYAPGPLTARIWDVATGRVPARPREEKAGIYCIAWSPDGGYVATGSDFATTDMVKIWDATTGRLVRGLRPRD